MAAVLLLVGSLGCPGRSQPKPSPTPPPRAAAGNGINVLLITIDTLRADHLGLYGYRRATSPHIDALGRAGAVFDQAYTYWPKTRGSFVMIHTGRRASQNGYSKTHPEVVGFNPTIASVLKEAGYRTAAVVDNPNVDAQLGYGKGFDTYRQTWQEKDLATEWDRTRAITAAGSRILQEAKGGPPVFLWLHYVNPHAPYTPPAPYDTRFLDGGEKTGPTLPIVNGFHGGVNKDWAIAGHDRLGWYVSQYDGEIAAADDQVGDLVGALRASGLLDRTLVIVTADHGESLGEHDYYFDHGEDVFDPCLRIPLIVSGPGVTAGTRTDGLASTLDLLPTILDAAKVSYPPDLAGQSLVPALAGRALPARPRLFSQNDRNLTATYDARYKLVAIPQDSGGASLALYDRQQDRGETKEVSRTQAETFRVHRRELELFQERGDKEWVSTNERLGQHKSAPVHLDKAACDNLIGLGYLGDPRCQ